MDIAIELYIFKLIYILNLSFNKQFWFLEQISKKKYTSGRKYKKMIIAIELKRITTNSTNPWFILATFRTYFFSPFSRLMMKKGKLQVLQKANHNSW